MKIIVSALLVALCASYATATAVVSYSQQANLTVYVNVQVSIGTGLSASLCTLGNSTLTGCVSGLTNLLSQLASAVANLKSGQTAQLVLIVDTLWPAILAQIQAANSTLTGLISTANTFATQALINLYASVVGLENLKAQILIGLCSDLKATYDYFISIGSSFAATIGAQLTQLLLVAEAALQASIVTALQLLVSVKSIAQLSIDIVVGVLGALVEALVIVEEWKIAFLLNTLSNIATLTSTQVTTITSMVNSSLSTAFSATAQAYAALLNASSAVQYVVLFGLETGFNALEYVVGNVIAVLQTSIPSVTGALATQLGAGIDTVTQFLGSVLSWLSRLERRKIDSLLNDLAIVGNFGTALLANVGAVISLLISSALSSISGGIAAIGNASQSVQSAIFAKLSTDLNALSNGTTLLLNSLVAQLATATGDLLVQLNVVSDNVRQVLGFIFGLIVYVEQLKLAILLNTLQFATSVTTDLIANTTAALSSSGITIANAIGQALTTITSATGVVKAAVLADLTAKLSVLQTVLGSIITALRAILATATGSLVPQITAAISSVAQLLNSVVYDLIIIEKLKLAIVTNIFSNGVILSAGVLSNVSNALQSVSISNALSAVNQSLGAISNETNAVQTALNANLTAGVLALQSQLCSLISALRNNLSNASSDLIPQITANLNIAVQVLNTILYTLGKLGRKQLYVLVNTLVNSVTLSADLLTNVSNVVNDTVSSVVLTVQQILESFENASTDVKTSLLANISAILGELESKVQLVLNSLQTQLANVSSDLAVLLNATVDTVLQDLAIVVNTLLTVERIKLLILTSVLTIGGDLTADLIAGLVGALNRLISVVLPFVGELLADLSTASQAVANAIIAKLSAKLILFMGVLKPLIVALQTTLANASGDLATQLQGVFETGLQVLSTVLGILARVESFKLTLFLNALKFAGGLTSDLSTALTATLNDISSGIWLSVGDVLSFVANASTAVQTGIVDKLCADLAVLQSVLVPVITGLKALLVNATGDMSAQLSALIDAAIQLLGSGVIAIENLESIKLQILLNILQTGINLTADLVASIVSALNVSLSLVSNAYSQVLNAIGSASQAVQSVLANILSAALTELQSLLASITDAINALLVNASGDLAGVLNGGLELVGGFAAQFNVSLSLTASISASASP